MKLRVEEVKPVFTVVVGIVTAEVYLDEGAYSVYMVGDSVKVPIGSYRSIDDCKRELDWLRQAADSELFKEAVSEM